MLWGKMNLGDMWWEVSLGKYDGEMKWRMSWDKWYLVTVCGWDQTCPWVKKMERWRCYEMHKMEDVMVKWDVPCLDKWDGGCHGVNEIMLWYV